MPIHKLRALEYLTAVVEHGGFNPAARKLGVAATSVHRLVKALEAELGIVLVDRSASPLRPTPDASTYVERVRQLLGELQGLDAGLHDHMAVPSGMVTIAAHSVVLQFVLPGLLGRLHQRHPKLRLDLVDAGSNRDLAQLGTDLLLQFGWPPPQEAMLRTLAESRWLVVASPAYWARHGVPSHPSELAWHPCMLYRTPYSEVLRRWVFERGGERVEVEVDGLAHRRPPRRARRAGVRGPARGPAQRPHRSRGPGCGYAAAGAARLGRRQRAAAEPVDPQGGVAPAACARGGRLPGRDRNRACPAPPAGRAASGAAGAATRLVQATRRVTGWPPVAEPDRRAR